MSIWGPQSIQELPTSVVSVSIGPLEGNLYEYGGPPVYLHRLFHKLGQTHVGVVAKGAISSSVSTCALYEDPFCKVNEDGKWLSQLNQKTMHWMGQQIINM